jgi:threonine dehydrogenase-like Zn-dependent dehydrogenase
MPVSTVRAAVTVAPNTTELRELPLPEIPPDGGLLRVLSAGICGSDIGYYAERDRGPRILGHENVGTIEALGPIAQERWGLAVGDTIALEEYLPCGYCEDCRSGEYRSCLKTETAGPGTLRYGSSGLDAEPGLWGGYAQFQYLHPRSVFHRVPAGVSPRIASMALPIGNGFQWAVLDGEAAPGKTVVIHGPGQQGLGCAVAAKAAGAKVVVSGLARDGYRLATAHELGIDRTVRADEESLLDAVRDVSDGRMADLVIDVSSGSGAVVAESLQLVRKRAKILVASYKRAPIDGFPIDDVIRLQATVRGVRGHSFRSVEMALALMAEHRMPLDFLATHEFGLADVDRGIRMLAGEIAGDAVHIAIDPWRA